MYTTFLSTTTFLAILIDYYSGTTTTSTALPCHNKWPESSTCSSSRKMICPSSSMRMCSYLLWVNLIFFSPFFSYCFTRFCDLEYISKSKELSYFFACLCLHVLLRNSALIGVHSVLFIVLGA
jgi:hypothetical protein